MNYTPTHLSDEDIARYCGRRMPPVELLAADDHLVLCDSCYARIGAAQGLDDKLLVASKAFDAATDYEVTHLTYEQMAAMADNRLDDIDREVIESHLELCRRCETELNDLREVSSAMDVTPAEQHVLSTPRAPSLQERLISLWRRPAFRIPAPAFAALAAVALAALLIQIPVRRERAELRARVAELEQGNQALKGQATAVEGIAVFDVSGKHVGDRFNPPVRVPRKACEVIVRVLVAEVVEQEERIEFRRVAEAKRALQLDARAFEVRARALHSFDGSNGHDGVSLGPWSGERAVQV